MKKKEKKNHNVLVKQISFRTIYIEYIYIYILFIIKNNHSFEIIFFHSKFMLFVGTVDDDTASGQCSTILLAYCVDCGILILKLDFRTFLSSLRIFKVTASRIFKRRKFRFWEKLYEALSKEKNKDY